MIEKLLHHVMIYDSNGESLSVPCDSDGLIVVALVPQPGEDRFDGLSVAHRPTGSELAGVFPAIGSGLARARKSVAEFLALPIDWSVSDHDALRTVISDHLDRLQPIRRSASMWITDFWSGEDEAEDE